MLSLVTTAEQLHRFDRDALDREQRLLLSIRERTLAAERDRAARRRSASPLVWARPIGLTASPACAVAC